ncbi:SnoaL-like domain-containing protein [Oceanospirillum multiglobuliferum]|uniref:SnoaL-like domain-containing protein n=1 Tax=Oceanospirillum multiglobuliferum TaxID=64969 RepID=A0A1T4SEJ5_9GAMM|nr:nuclear transport factor 2 family protein [Oceanospirillum multiglobuliferum]OPX54322.1 hypothetical protein BTE48_14765 [Oceanospirillum multiglobuliferum]SKA26348.1 SnoaL-like domain-containing protein [Oceanospirillum multiglobuliferum]
MPTPLTPAQHSLQQYFQLFQQRSSHTTPLTPEQIQAIVAPDILFKDPFQQINGPQAFCQMLNHFHQQVQQPCFQIEQQLSQDQQLWLVKWQFTGQLKSLGAWQFSGISEITLNAQGQVQRHIDYWDAAEHFYEKLPFLGRVLRWVKGKVAQ